MTKITFLQRRLLEQASAPDGSYVGAPHDADPKKAAAALKALLKAELMQSTLVDGHSPQITITAAGRALLGVTATPAALAGAADSAAIAPTRKEPKGKIGAVILLLRSPNGTTVEAMMAATGWQAHSVRGAISGAIKKGQGLTVTSEKTETGRVYRIHADVEA